MLLIIDYLQRTGELYSHDFLPCSIFINTKNHEAKIVITVKASEDSSKLCVQHWFVSSCPSDSSLPTLKDYKIDKIDLFDSPFTMIKSFNLLKYKGVGVPLNKNVGNGGHPMSYDLYKKYLSNLFCEGGHNIAKEIWLWHAFLDTYIDLNKSYLFDEFSLHERVYFGRKFPLMRMRSQQSTVYSRLKAIWKNWELWKKHLLFKEKMSGELVFATAYDAISSSAS